ncbi:MAG: CAP domain-containing protein [Nostoc sp.]|uniref:CAP domain-containing protein n=1 Tax=Nostoc sp. TaxID=1180 RepID=UPI002FFD5057
MSSSNQVTIYDDSQYQGFAQTLNVGKYDWGQIHNDTISSLRVPNGMRVTLYNDIKFGGRSKTFTADTPYVGDDFNDITSSIVVENGTPSLNVVGRMLELVNQQRGAAGLAPLSLNSQLTVAAQGHSQDMADHNFMAHNGSDGSSPFDRMQKAGYRFSFAGENVAAGQSTPEDATSSWMNETPPNDGHRQNILNPNYREIGIGYAFSDAAQFKHYWTQDFGTPL